MALGYALKAAREACGMSISDLSAKTHLMTPVIIDLETENFKHIPAAIYGRGFVKIYCEAVGITGIKEMQAEFVAIYNGKPVEKAAPKQNVPARTDTQTEPKRHQVPHVPSLPKEEHELPPPTPKAAPRMQVQKFKKPEIIMPDVNVNWRKVGLLVSLVVFVAAVGFGFKLMYQTMKMTPAAQEATEATEAQEAQEVVAETPAPMVDDKKPTTKSAEEEAPAKPAKRVPIKIEPLYID